MRFKPDYSRGPWTTQPFACVYDWLVIAVVALGFLGLPVLMKAQRVGVKQGWVCEETYWREADGAIAHERTCRRGGRNANRVPETN